MNRVLAARFALPLVGFLVFATALGVNLQMPLYVSYAEAGGYGTSAIAAVFAFYALTLVAFLLSLGGLSDAIGRKPAMIGAGVSALAATLLVQIWPTLEAVAVARVLQGLAVGLATSAGTAYAAELAGAPDAAKSAARTITATVSAGFGVRALATALALLVTPAATPITYWLHMILATSAIALAAILPETRAPNAGTWMRLPLFPKGTVALAAAIIPAWTVTGILIAVVPSVMAANGLSGFNWAALSLFLINLVGVAFQSLSARLSPRRSVLLGLILLNLGMVGISAGAVAGSAPILVLGAIVAGSAAYGFIFTGGLTAVSVAAGAERARAAAGFFLFAYIGFSVPPLLTGLVFGLLGATATLAAATVSIALASCLIAAVSLVPGGSNSSADKT